MSDPTPPRATLEEALADAQWDYVMHGAMYVIQHTGQWAKWIGLEDDVALMVGCDMTARRWLRHGA